MPGTSKTKETNLWSESEQGEISHGDVDLKRSFEIRNLSRRLPIVKSALNQVNSGTLGCNLRQASTKQKLAFRKKSSREL